MEAKAAILSRRSVRNFNSRPLSQRLIEELIDCARLAPTARNLQPWEFVAVTKRKTLEDLAGITADNGRFIAESACCIAVFCRDTKYYLEDGCAATENILIRAADLGLAGCWVAGDKKPYCEKVKALLGLSADFKLVSLVALGYSDTPGEAPGKKPLKEILHWEKF